MEVSTMKFQCPYDISCEGALWKQTEYIWFSNHSTMASMIGLCHVNRAKLEQATEYSEGVSLCGRQ